MSLRLRVKYKYRSASRRVKYLLLAAKLPDWLNGAAFRYALFAMVAVSTVAFVAQINSLGAAGYQAHALERQISELNSEIKTLETSVAETQSLASIQSRLSAINMVAPTDVKYLSISLESAVAKK